MSVEIDKLRRQLTLYILLRLVLGFFFMGIVALFFLGAGHLRQDAFNQLLLITFAALGLSALGLRLPARRIWLQRLAYLQHVIDVSILATLLAYTGGTKSIFSPLLLLSIVASAYLVGRRGALAVATLHAVAFLAVGLAHVHGGLPGGALAPLTEQSVTVYADILTMTFACYLTATLSGFLARRIQVAEAEAREAVGLLEVEEARVRKLQSDLAQVVLSLRSGLAIFDRSGGLRSANDIALGLFPEFASASLPSVFPEQIRAGVTIWEVERGQGEAARALILTRSPLEDGGEVLTIEDVTLLRKMERTVQREERNAAVGRLAAAMAHEIRNPLTSLSSAVQIMADVGPSERLLAIVDREVGRLDKLVNDLLNAARPRELRLERVAIQEIIYGVVESFGADARYTDKVQVHTIVDAADLLADPEQLQQVLWNLLLNAAQAMPAGGNIRIRCQRVSDRVRMLVEDDGIGIPEHDMEHIFDPFYTTREGGTGLGLATVDRVIRRHGGEIQVRARPGGGTCFVIWLPAERSDKALEVAANEAQIEHRSQ